MRMACLMQECKEQLASALQEVARLSVRATDAERTAGLAAADVRELAGRCGHDRSFSAC